MFSLATIIRMNAAVDRKRRKDQARARARRAARKAALYDAMKSAADAATNRYLQDNDQ